MQNNSLILFDTQNNTTDHVPFKAPSAYSDYLWWDPIWHPHKDILITSADTSLFEIDLGGNFTEYPITTVADIYSPMYHPDGNKIIAVIGGINLDTDEYSIVSKNSVTQDKSELSAKILQTIHPSTVEDYQAKYQPTNQPRTT
ncbi:hypothetical protein N8Z89_00450 [bacterium]|nr:hypothetical protein [bacterium]